MTLLKMSKEDEIIQKNLESLNTDNRLRHRIRRKLMLLKAKVKQVFS